MRTCEDGNNFRLLVEGPTPLSRGFLGLGGEVNVEDGAVGLLLVDGRHHTTLPAGRYSLNQFPSGSDLSVYSIATSPRDMVFRSSNELYVQEVGQDGSVAPVKVDIEMVISYEVNLKNVSKLVSHGNPLNNLCALLFAAVRDEITHWSFEAFRTGGSRLGKKVKESVFHKAEHNLGITLLEITPTSLMGADRIAQQQVQQVLNSRDPVDQGWKIRNSPEIYIKEQEIKAQIMQLDYQLRHDRAMQTDSHTFQTVQRLLDEYLRIGGDPGRILDQQIRSSGNDSLARILDQLFGDTRDSDNSRLIEAVPETRPNAVRDPQPKKEPVSGEKIDAEWEALEQAGYTVSGSPGVTGARSIPDGSFNFTVNLSEIADGLEVRLHLPVGYEQGELPHRQVFRNGERQKFPEVDASDWRNEPSLIRLVDEVETYFE